MWSWAESQDECFLYPGKGGVTVRPSRHKDRQRAPFNISEQHSITIWYCRRSVRYRVYSVSTRDVPATKVKCSTLAGLFLASLLFLVLSLLSQPLGDEL